MMRRLCNLQDFCRAKKRKISASVSEAAGVAVESMDYARVLSSPGEGRIVDLLIDKWTEQLASTRAEVVSLMANLSDLEDTRENEEREQEGLV